MDEPIALRLGEGELAGTSVVKAARPELSLLEFEIKPGGGVQPHFHKLHSDSFYVLEGELEFHVEDEVIRGSVGTYVLAPPGVVHFFRNVSDEPTRALNLHTPGGFVEYRRELPLFRPEGSSLTMRSSSSTTCSTSDHGVRPVGSDPSFRRSG